MSKQKAASYGLAGRNCTKVKFSAKGFDKWQLYKERWVYCQVVESKNPLAEETNLFWCLGERFLLLLSSFYWQAFIFLQAPLQQDKNHLNSIIRLDSLCFGAFCRFGSVRGPESKMNNHSICPFYFLKFAFMSLWPALLLARFLKNPCKSTSLLFCKLVTKYRNNLFFVCFAALNKIKT